MSESKGCLKKTLIGCGGALAVVIVLSIIGTTFMFRQVNQRQEIEPVLAPLDEPVRTERASAGQSLQIVPPAGRPGRIVIVLGQGEFLVRPADPGEGPSAEARYNPDVHEFVESYELHADSTWVYKVGFRRHKSGFGAFIEAIFGEKVDASVKINLPPDWPLELDFEGEDGGAEMELGGLWLTDADLRFKKGGIVLTFDEPLREPMRHLVMQASMGGFEVESLGNASPRYLQVNCGMGGANIDMEGEWRQACDAEFTATMGGIAVSMPEDVEANNVSESGGPVLEAPREAPGPAINYRISAKWGEVDVLD